MQLLFGATLKTFVLSGLLSSRKQIGSPWIFDERLRACRESATGEAALRLSRRSAFKVARDRVGDGLVWR